MSASEALILQAKLLWDGDEATNGMAKAGEQATGLQGKIAGAFKKIGAAVAAAFTIDAIKNFVVSTIDAGAAVSAEMSAFEQIMGSYADTASQKMNSVADSTGMVASRLTPYMTSMTAKFKGLGYDIDDATSMASRGLTLAADSAAFWDKSLDESMSHLNSFINGSYEGGEAIGLFANDTQMAMYAVEQGLVATTGEWSKLDEATKQATRLEYAENMMELSGAVGQASKESGQYANVMANMAERWRQFKAQIGQPIIQNLVIPAVQKLTKGIDLLSKGVDHVKKNFKSWMQEAKKLAPALQAAIAIYAGFKVGTAIQGIVTGFQKARLAVALFTAGQSKAQIATALSTGALKLHEIAVGLMTGKIKLAQVATALWTKAQTVLNMVLNANPIGLVVMAIAAVVAALVLAYNKCDWFREKVQELWSWLGEKLAPVGEALADFWTNTLAPAFEKVGNYLGGAFATACSTAKSWLSDKLGGAVSAVAGWISGTLVPTLQQWGGYINENIIPALSGLWSAISEKVQPILQAVSDFITGTVAPAFQTIGQKIMELVTLAAPILGVFRTIWTTVWNNIMIVASTVWNVIKTVVSTALQAIRQVILIITSAIRGDWSGVWNGIKNLVSIVWNGIKSVISTVFSGIWSFIKNTLAGIRSAWNIAWTVVKAVASSIWSSIKATIQEKIEAARDAIDSAVEKIKNFMNFEGALDAASGVFGSIKSAIEEKIGAARDFIEGAIEKIKGFFDFEWSLPPIKLPHFSISGSFSLNPPSIPKISVSWYKKAMENAMVLNDPTIFGAAGGELLGAGEAGPEVISGEAHLMDMIGRTVSANNAGVVEALYKILGAIQDMDEGLYDHVVDALTDGVQFRLDGREFGRLVKTYA